MEKSADKKTSFIRRLAEPVLSSGITFWAGAAVIAAFLVSLWAVFAGKRWTGAEFAGELLALIIIYGLFVFLFSRLITGRKMETKEVTLLSFFIAAYLVCAAFTRKTEFLGGWLPSSAALPTALFVMLTGLVVNERLAKVMALVLPQAALLAGDVNTATYCLALASGLAASLVVRQARDRMDLVKAGCLVSLVMMIVEGGIIIFRAGTMQLASAAYIPAALFWCFVHGLASGCLALGLLPVLEKILRKATTFRLFELLDLDAPVMKRLAAVTPGTFIHSLIMANMAEAACQEIGANGLLARVGAYYHDIGKMENPEYFVENQKQGNKHNELQNPRLSATIIRSHVKLGVEKARALGLPTEVIDIIGSHHGDSLISYFYSEAVKKEGPGVDKEDFSYPGEPPRSKEAAVVMLADVSEAATRTLENPTLPRLEKFIGELIAKKEEEGQLAHCELTFRDLETIKNSFVRTLVSYHHSRIEYPKAPAQEKQSGYAAQDKHLQEEKAEKSETEAKKS
jgi:putative nucleotidyltransferase with HDIG domain